MAIHYDPTRQKEELYAMTGYWVQQPEVFEIEIDPSDLNYGKVIRGPISIDPPASDGSDGFTVLPNGDFLINEGEASPVYDEYDGTTGARIYIAPDGPLVDLGSLFGLNWATGVALAPDGQSLYFHAGIRQHSWETGQNPSFIQTDLTGHLIRAEPFVNPNSLNGGAIEDISFVIP
ncbi:MAG: hypothetical protein KGJ60_00895 [Verrucomicrobiota bacterium]|nr:hypothetical protein [Verrucomicrobiota bacterium]